LQGSPPDQSSNQGQWGLHYKGYENTSIDMTLSIVGISEMQKCGLKYVIHILGKTKGGAYN
jgi:hypothetical protein